MSANHKTTQKMDAHPAKRWRRLFLVLISISLYFAFFLPVVAQAAETQHGTPPLGKIPYNTPALDSTQATEETTAQTHTAGMFAFTKRAYNTVKHITIPLAIVSFATCGYYYLGAIFFGTYNAPRAGERARKQFVWTVVVVAIVILFPNIVSFAEHFFVPNAWRPST